jgi:hypothetical protein
MPEAVKALIYEQWDLLDPNGTAMVSAMRTLASTNEFAHARDTFANHLVGTFGTLAVWQQPVVVRRAGLFHTAFSGDLFQFFLWDASEPAERAVLVDIIGPAAERLVWLFGTVNRGALCGLSAVINGSIDAALALPSASSEESGSGAVTARHRLDGATSLSPREVANLMIVTVADYIEQLVEINGWRDHHQIESPASLFPGDGRPGVALFWLSAICKAVAHHLETRPPVFEGCTRVLSRADELAARDAYWRVVTAEAMLSDDEMVSELLRCTHLNPFVGEPDFLIAQIHFRNGRFRDSARHCASCLAKMFALATAWDKRRSYGAWVGHARLLALRANRRLSGFPESLPTEASMPRTATGLPLVSIRKLVQLMHDAEDPDSWEPGTSKGLLE